MKVTDRSPAARRSSFWSVAFPKEHGGWGLTLEPGLLGLLIAPGAAGFCLAAAALWRSPRARPSGSFSSTVTATVGSNARRSPSAWRSES